MEKADVCEVCKQINIFHHFFFFNNLQSLHITETVSSMQVNNLQYIFLLDVGLKYVSPFLTSHHPEWCCGTLEGVGPAESTFLWDSQHSPLSTQSLPTSQPQKDRHMTAITISGCVWVLVMLNYPSLTLQKRFLFCLVNH